MIIDLVDNGESGIRTHAPLRTNGFQDRLVMTTSISLQTCLSIIQRLLTLVKRFLELFLFFFVVVSCADREAQKTLKSEYGEISKWS